MRRGSPGPRGFSRRARPSPFRPRRSTGSAPTRDPGMAVARIFGAKGRPRFNPLIVHVADIGMARQIAAFDPRAEKVAAAFWPGPLTLVLPLREAAGISDLVTAGRAHTVAVRMPAHPVARALLSAFGGPVAAPSASPSGKVSPTRADHVLAGLSGRIAVIDGGACDVGGGWAILDLSDGPALLRPSGIPAEALEACLGAPLGGRRGRAPQRAGPAGLALRARGPHAARRDAAGSGRILARLRTGGGIRRPQPLGRGRPEGGGGEPLPLPARSRRPRSRGPSPCRRFRKPASAAPRSRPAAPGGRTETGRLTFPSRPGITRARQRRTVSADRPRRACRARGSIFRRCGRKDQIERRIAGEPAGFRISSSSCPGPQPA